MGLGVSSLRLVRYREDFSWASLSEGWYYFVERGFVRVCSGGGGDKKSAFSRVLRNDLFYSCGAWDGHVGTGF